jgi:hypothetical protein
MMVGWLKGKAWAKDCNQQEREGSFDVQRQRHHDTLRRSSYLLRRFVFNF